MESIDLMTPARRYWLMKSEPTAFSIEDFRKEKNQTTGWEGVRNYQARNFLRDDIRKGDGVFFYHSNAKPSGIIGEAVVVKEGYPDSTAWDSKSQYYDPKSSPENPVWYKVDVKLIQISRKIITLERLRRIPGLSRMTVLRKGSRLSVQPVTSKEWEIINNLPEWRE